MKPFYDNITHTAPCADPGLPSNGKRDSSNFGHNKTVIFQCNDNYTMVGNERMSCNDGVWSAELPQCKGKSQSKNSKVFERKRPTQGKLFSKHGKGLILTSPSCFLIVSYETFVRKYYSHSAVCRPWSTFQWQTRRFRLWPRQGSHIPMQ